MLTYSTYGGYDCWLDKRLRDAERLGRRPLVCELRALADGGLVGKRFVLDVSREAGALPLVIEHEPAEDWNNARTIRATISEEQWKGIRDRGGAYLVSENGYLDVKEMTNAA